MSRKEESAQFRDGASMGAASFVEAESTDEARSARRKQAADYIRSLPDDEQETAWDGFEEDERLFAQELTAAQAEMRKNAPDGTVFVENFASAMGRLMDQGLSANQAFNRMAIEVAKGFQVVEDEVSGGKSDQCACGGGCGCGRGD
jgi:hypothetical protein